MSIYGDYDLILRVGIVLITGIIMFVGMSETNKEKKPKH